MAKTEPGTEHRHMTSGKKWSDLTDLASGKPHTHNLDVAKFSDAEIAAMKARMFPVAPPVEPPPVVPPPVEPPPPTAGTVPADKFQSAVQGASAGQTLSLAAIQYDIPGATYLYANDVKILAAAPTPRIKPAGRPNGLFIKGSRSTVRGLDFISAPGKPEYNDPDGSALLEVLGYDAPVVDTLIENIGLDLPVVAGTRQHGMYLAYDIRRLTVRNIRSNGHASQGGQADGLTAYHMGTAPCEDIVFEDWTFTDHFNAIVFWLWCVGLTFRRCKFVGTINVDGQFQTGGPVRFEGCTGSKPLIFEAGSTFVDGGGNNLGTVITR